MSGGSAASGTSAWAGVGRKSAISRGGSEASQVAQVERRKRRNMGESREGENRLEPRFVLRSREDEVERTMGRNGRRCPRT